MLLTYLGAILVFRLYPSQAYWCERPELFAAIADATSDEERALAVLKWFVVRLCFLVNASGSPDHQ